MKALIKFYNFIASLRYHKWCAWWMLNVLRLLKSLSEFWICDERFWKERAWHHEHEATMILQQLYFLPQSFKYYDSDDDETLLMNFILSWRHMYFIDDEFIEVRWVSVFIEKVDVFTGKTDVFTEKMGVFTGNLLKWCANCKTCDYKQCLYYQYYNNI